MIVFTKSPLARKGYRSLLLATAFSALCVTAGGAQAQINIGGPNPSTYNQNFNTLVSSNIPAPSFTNNSTILGLYAAGSSSYLASNGFTATQGFYSYGADNNSERAFGSLVVSNTLFFGFRFVNTSPSLVVTNFNLSYSGEQWRRAQASSQSQRLDFEYAVFNSNQGSINAAEYFAVDELDFGVTSTGTTLINNAAPFVTTPVTGSVNLEDEGNAVLPGQELWIRWQDANNGGNDHGLAVDNVQLQFTLVPEISTLQAMLLAGVVAVVPAWRMARRRKSSTL